MAAVLESFWPYRASKRQLSRMLRRARHGLEWSLGENPRSAKLFQASKPTLNTGQRTAAEQLLRRGLGIVPFQSLEPNAEAWGRLRKVVEDFCAGDRVREGIANFRKTVEEDKYTNNDVYLVKLYPEGPTLDLDNPLLQIGLSSQVLDVVNSYLGLWAKMLYTDVWHSIPIDVGHRLGSQRWHRDPEDRKIVKVYLYFGEVDVGAGAMEYVNGSAVGGRWESFWKWRVKGHHYLPEGQVEGKVPQSDILRCEGPAGTLVFCDTSGLHRGGIATTHARVLATWTFCTPAALPLNTHRRFQLTPESDPSKLSPAARFALA